MAYIVLYIVIIIIALYGYSNNDKRIKKSLWAIFVVITLFQGLRWNTGADWAQYEYTFRTATWSNIFSYQRGLQERIMEPGYMFLNILIKSIFVHYTFFLLITCGFINYTLRVLSKRYIHPEYQTLAYAMLIICSSICPVRQGLACAAFFLWGLPYMHQKNFIRFAFIVFLCYMIHYSCLILLFFYWIDRPVKIYILLGIYLCSSIIAELIPSVFNFLTNIPFLKDSSFTSLTSMVMEQQRSGLEKKGLNNLFTIIITSIFLLIFGFVRDRTPKRDKTYNNLSMLLNLYFIASLGSQLSLLPGLSEFARLGYWGGIGLPLLFVYSLRWFTKKFYKFKYLLLLFFVFFYFYKGKSVFEGTYSDLFVPYYSVFEESRPRDVWYY